ncbi:hypothetical protein [Yersinia massiliensis]|uniref:hypothetical protein n=1 Tax=Yersinia massiliensis TaxID=419257 RepID=UPI0020B74581|nr:hypothetical protein [Yersinia massiliensis]
MLHWLNTHIGNDWATYQGWGISIIGLGITVFATPKIIKNFKLSQTNKNSNGNGNGNGNGNINQAGRDLKITTINHISHSKIESDIEEKKKAHDLKIIEEILTLLPYEATLYEAEQSYIVGMTYQFARNLDEAGKYMNEKYKLYNSAVNEVKYNFIIAITAFYNSLTPFLTVDHPEKEPLRLDLPYDWRNNPKSERTYRKYQSEMCETSAVMIENYQLFIKTIKENEFITDTI